MKTLTLDDVPDELFDWLKQQAHTHHHSVNREIVNLLENLMEKARDNPMITRHEKYAAILEISQRCSELQNLDTRSADDILGYDNHGLPG